MTKNQVRLKVKPIEPIWAGDTVVCIASGPSLDTDDLDYVRDKARVIAINDNHKLAPWADVLYACDFKWWQWHGGVPEFPGVKYTQDKIAALQYDLNYIEGKPGKGLSKDPSHIHTGKNSGFQAINLAYLLGASRIVLTGFDMKVADNGAAHWFGEHPDRLRSSYPTFEKEFHDIPPQGLVEVINCTRDTALTAFTKAPLKDIL